MTPCCRPPSTRSRTLPRCPPRSPCIWTPAMTTDPAERHSTSAACTARSPIAGAGADPGRPALGRRADQLLAQRLRQAAPLHRAPPRLRRCLPRPGRRDRHPPCPASGRLVPLSLGHSTEITTHPLTYWRTPLGRTDPQLRDPALYAATHPSGRRPALLGQAVRSAVNPLEGRELARWQWSAVGHNATMTNAVSCGVVLR